MLSPCGALPCRERLKQSCEAAEAAAGGAPPLSPSALAAGLSAPAPKAALSAPALASALSELALQASRGAFLRAACGEERDA